MQPAQPHDDNSKLDALVAQYLEALERGEQPDRKQFLKQYPDIATELQEFFADLDKVQAAKEKARPELAATIIPQHEPKPGAIISGRYKLLENISEGGMGSVWVAEQQQPVKRRVAIKLVKAGSDSNQVRAIRAEGCEREDFRQLLESLPNVPDPATDRSSPADSTQPKR